ncbi:hypothetical protein [Tardibacter chloracetimidivorans]|uniref:hypothetical protein n=1 Tax=Tardibacter chloracetimidivorans TaxID=1921510 RepID=UPI0009FB0D96|nr:hypothetical protein [Tardibacter chloracetimidivorans]
MSGGARTGLIIAVVAVLVVIAVFAFGLVDIDQTRETALPEVKTEGGQMPAFDVDTADVDVGTTTETVELPKVDVDTTKEEVKVPTVDVEPTE